jgi:hypothetical protein
MCRNFARDIERYLLPIVQIACRGLKGFKVRTEKNMSTFVPLALGSQRSIPKRPERRCTTSSHHHHHQSSQHHFRGYTKLGKELASTRNAFSLHRTRLERFRAMVVIQMTTPTSPHREKATCDARGWEARKLCRLDLGDRSTVERHLLWSLEISDRGAWAGWASYHDDHQLRYCSVLHTLEQIHRLIDGMQRSAKGQALD